MSALWTVSRDDAVDGDSDDKPAAAAGLGAAEVSGDRRVIRSEQLMRGAREVVILHNDQRYRLVVTRNGKLILQK